MQGSRKKDGSNLFGTLLLGAAGALIGMAAYNTVKKSQPLKSLYEYKKDEEQVKRLEMAQIEYRNREVQEAKEEEKKFEIDLKDFTEE